MKHHRSSCVEVVLPVVLVLIISVAVIAGLLLIAARGQDRVANDNSIHLARSVLADIERRLAQRRSIMPIGTKR